MLTRLGESDISVELTPDDFREVINSTLDMYNRYQPKIIEQHLSAKSGKQDYRLEWWKVGRAVWDVVFRRTTTTVTNLFPAEFFPVNRGSDSDFIHGSSPLGAEDILNFRMVSEADQKVFGTFEDFHYFPDENRLRLYPPPTGSGVVTVITLHDRLFEEFDFGTIGNGTDTEYTLTFTDDDGFPFKDFTPNVMIKTDQENFRSVGSHDLEGSQGGSGNVDPDTGKVTLNFNSPPDSIRAHGYISEIRPQDQTWFKEYATAVAKTIVGHKRNYFGSVPGVQNQVELDTDIRQQGFDDMERLRKEAEVWSMQWAVPRKD